MNLLEILILLGIIGIGIYVLTIGFSFIVYILVGIGVIFYSFGKWIASLFNK